MRQQLSCSGCESLGRMTTGQPRSLVGNRTANIWRGVLDALIGAPLRLHRYRHLHAEVIEDALRAFDCGPQRGDRS
jgi:hypothetical protein